MERMPTVVFHLSGDVLANCRDVGAAHREPTVTLLPCKCRPPDLLVHPTRRCLLDLPYYVGQAVRCAKSEEQMDMIFDTADLLGDAVDRLHTTAEIGVKIAAPLGVDPSF